jgi:tetratricopeptide (TPR) repeat protein
MLRLAPAGAWILALAPLACAAALACGGPQPPPPSKLSEAASPIQAPVKPKPEVESPFRPPSKEPPLPRSGPQLPPAELAATLASADEARKIGDEVSAAAALRSCANKVPQDVRCEGELGALLARSPRFKYEADYYLDQVAKAADDPALDIGYYQRLGEALTVKGRNLEAATAYQRIIDRKTPATAEDYNRLSVTLQGVPDHLNEAAEALRRAYELDPTHIEWIRDQGILLGQLPDKLPRAIELFEQYKARIQDPELLADTDRRILEAQMELQKLTPTPADPGAAAPTTKRKNARKKKPAAGNP